MYLAYSMFVMVLLAQIFKDVLDEVDQVGEEDHAVLCVPPVHGRGHHTVGLKIKEVKQNPPERPLPWHFIPLFLLPF